MHESERRQALADFLRKRRARLSPVDVGLPPGMRRRTPGLRREEVAQLANIGASWYVWLEQGRDVHPSAQVLESLARALKLTLNERRHLFLLAGQPIPPNASVLEEKVSPALQQVLDDLNPTPAYVMGRRWDYLAWNRAADGIFTLTDASLPYGRNLLWRVFTNPLLRQRPDREQMLRGSLAEFRTALARYPGDEYFEELIEEIKQVSSEFRNWWPHHDASSTLDIYKIIEHPTLGHLEFESVNLQVAGDPDIKVVIYTPLGETRAKLQRFQEVQAVSSV